MSFKTTNLIERVVARVENHMPKVDRWLTSDQQLRSFATALGVIERPRPTSVGSGLLQRVVYITASGVATSMEQRKRGLGFDS